MKKNKIILWCLMSLSGYFSWSQSVISNAGNSSSSSTISLQWTLVTSTSLTPNVQLTNGFQ